MPVGKEKKYIQRAQQRKTPEVVIPGFFYSVFGMVAYSIGWLPATCRHPTIWWCNGKLHQPRQRQEKEWIYPRSAPPFCTNIGGGNVLIITHRCNFIHFFFFKRILQWKIAYAIMPIGKKWANCFHCEAAQTRSPQPCCCTVGGFFLFLQKSYQPISQE